METTHRQPRVRHTTYAKGTGSTDGVDESCQKHRHCVLVRWDDNADTVEHHEGKDLEMV